MRANKAKDKIPILKGGDPAAMSQRKSENKNFRFRGFYSVSKDFHMCLEIPLEKFSIKPDPWLFIAESRMDSASLFRADHWVKLDLTYWSKMHYLLDRD